MACSWPRCCYLVPCNLFSSVFATKSIAHFSEQNHTIYMLLCGVFYVAEECFLLETFSDWTPFV